MRNAKATSKARLVGYARVSTEEQHTDPQADELRASGCAVIHEEHASGADRSRPVLAQLLHNIGPGETLVVVRLDRLARSVGHLLAVIEQLEAKGAHFRSLRDPIDTTTPQGMFSLQVLGAVAQLERALIAERTKAGLQSAKARGRIGGNPGLCAHDPAAIRKLRSARDAAHLDVLLASIDDWLPTVRRMRPNQSWDDVVRVLTHGRTSLSRSTAAKLLSPTAMNAVRAARAPPGSDLPGPVGQFLVPSLALLVLLPIPFRGCQHGQERQRPAPPAQGMSGNSIRDSQRRPLALTKWPREERTGSR